jgi:RNA polymerase sigma-70 factor (ECF subfamily)
MTEERTLSGPIPATLSRELARAFERCRNRGHAIAVQITGDPEDAADLVQQAFLQAQRGIGSFRAEGTLEAWILRIVVNLSLKLLRRRKVRQALRHLIPVGEPPASVEWLVGCREELRWLGRALERLPARQRAAFVLRHAQGLSVIEVAGLMELSVPTVKTHLMRATERLRRELQRNKR